jgi:hypothetical protein
MIIGRPQGHPFPQLACSCGRRDSRGRCLVRRPRPRSSCCLAQPDCDGAELLEPRWVGGVKGKVRRNGEAFACRRDRVRAARGDRCRSGPGAAEPTGRRRRRASNVTRLVSQCCGCGWYEHRRAALLYGRLTSGVRSNVRCLAGPPATHVPGPGPRGRAREPSRAAARKEAGDLRPGCDGYLSREVAEWFRGQ